MSARAARFSLLALAVVIVQQLVMARFTIFGVHPDLLLLFTICVGIAGGPNRGAIVGFVAGLIDDSLLQLPLGLSAFAFVAAGYAVGLLSEGDRELAWMRSALGALGTALALVLIVVIGHISGDIAIATPTALKIIFVLALFNAVFSPLITRFLLPEFSQRRREMVW